MLQCTPPMCGIPGLLGIQCKSMMWFRQIAQLSTTISHAQRATAFHFLTSNLFLAQQGVATADDEGWSVSINSNLIPEAMISYLSNRAFPTINNNVCTTIN